MRRECRRFFFANLTRVTWGVRATVLGLLVWLAVHYWRTIQHLFAAADHFVRPYAFPQGTIGDVILTGIIQGTAALLVLQSIRHLMSASHWAILRRRLLPVNVDLTSEHHKRISDYMDAAASRIRQLLPEDLKIIAAEKPKISPMLLPLEGEGNPSLVAAEIEYGRIPNVLEAIDRDYLLTHASDVPPLILQGDPGCGKSTLIFELFRIVRVRLEQYKHGWIPLIVFVHDLHPEVINACKTMQELLVAYFAERARMLGQSGYQDIADFLRTSYDQYRFVIIFDGLDEFGDRRTYTAMAMSLNRLIDPRTDGDKEKVPFPGTNRYIISCRSEDNQQKVSGTLVTLTPLTLEHVMKYLIACRRQHRRRRRTEDASRVADAITGLRASQEDGLLQNYVTNPYLLSLIAKYYTHQRTPLAKTLNDVFRDVLERELEKAHGPDSQLMKYVPRLLAPYAYMRVTSSLDGSDGSVDFISAVRAEPTLARILFGDTTRPGYLIAAFSEDHSMLLSRHVELAQEWGPEEANVFQESLSAMRATCTSFDDFEAGAVNGIRKRLFQILQESTMAVFTTTGHDIERFRHRRLQDYFVALHIDRVGLSRCSAIGSRLANAWLREPLRIYAAIARTPQDLFRACASFFEAIDEMTGLNVFERLHLATNVLVNASSAVAYLPAVHETPLQAVVDAVLILGKQTHDLYHLLLSESAAIATGSRSEAYLLRIKCLECFKNIYASEFLSSFALRNATVGLFDTCYQTIQKVKFNSWISLYRKTLKQGEPYQHLSYVYLYPIKDAHRGFPVARFSLFLYIAEVVLVFEQKYDEFVRSTHKTRLSRFPLATASAVGQLSTLMFPVSVLWLGWRIFGWSIIGLVLLAGAALALVFFMRWAQERGMIGDRRELKALPFWAVLVFIKRSLGRGISVPEPAIDQLPRSLLTQASSASAIPIVQTLYEMPAQPPDAAVIVPSPSLIPTSSPTGHKFSVGTRRAAWAVGSVLCVAGLAAASPWILNTSRSLIRRENVLELRVKAYRSIQDIRQLAVATSSLVSRQAEHTELDSLRERLSAKIDQIDRLLATADALNEDSSISAHDGSLASTMAALRSAKERTSALDARVLELLAQENNTAEWESLKSKIEEIRASITGFQPPLSDASSAAIEALLKKHADYRSGVEALRAAAGTFNDRLLLGSLRPEVERPLGALDELGRTLERQEALLLNSLTSARLREAVADFSNGVPVLVAEIQTAVRTKTAANLPALRAETTAARQLADRLREHVAKGRWLLEKDLPLTTKGEIERGLLKLQAASGIQIEHLTHLEQELGSVQVIAALRVFAATTDKLESDLRDLVRTKFASPQDALEALRGARERFQSALSSGVSLTQQTTTEDQSSTVAEQMSRLTDGISELDTLTAKWNARMDDQKRESAIADLRGHVQQALAQPAGTFAGANWLVQESGRIESEWENLNRPPELKLEIEKLRHVRRQAESLLRKAQREAEAPVVPVPQPLKSPVKSAEVTLIETRCESLVEQYGQDTNRGEEVNTFLSHDATALRNDMQAVAAGPRVLSHISGAYREATARLSRFHQVNSSLPALIQTTSAVLAPSREILADPKTPTSCRETLTSIVRINESTNEEIRAVEELGQQIAAMDFETALMKSESEARQRTMELGAYVLSGIVVAVVVIVILIVSGRISDRKGFVVLKRCQNSFDGLLAFCVNNTYSRTVNFRATAYLQPRIPHTPDALRKLSDAAQAREKRGPGVLNGDVANRLRELARGLDNILNR